MRSTFVTFLAAAFLGMIVSCAPKYGAHFTNISEKYPRNKLAAKKIIPAKMNHEQETVGIIEATEESTEMNRPGESVVASTNNKVAFKKKIEEHVANYEKRVEEAKTKNIDSKAFNKEVRHAKKELKKDIKSTIKREIKDARESGADDDYVLMMVLAFFIPPLAVGLTYGITNEFWISLILTILLWLPGAIYALIMVHRYYE